MTSRSAPPRFESCTLDGVRYEAEYPFTEGPSGTRSGGIVAVDAATGDRLWSLVLWTSPRVLEGGLSVPPRYLHRITSDLGPGTLRVVDEYGFAYRVDLATRTARAIGRAEPAAAHGAIALHTRSESRVGRPSPAPIVFEGRRYQQILNGEREGLGQRTGLMSVTDVASNQRVDVARIYDDPRREGLGDDPDDGFFVSVEPDAGDVFFLSAELDADRREIVIESERHERFAYRIDDGSVHRLS